MKGINASNNIHQIHAKLDPKSDYSLLLVDDSLIDLKILSNTLGGLFKISFARSVDEAIELLENGLNPDIVLLDIVMPGKKGYEFCEYLKLKPSTTNIPVIFVSGLESIEDKTKGFSFGAVDYITKPYEPLELQVRLLTQLQTVAKIKHLENLAHIDSLTQVANRRKYELMLADEWNRCSRHKESLALIVFDIDYFKSFNDSFGHPAGDKCLTTVAGALAKLASRSFDVFARVGGEEFILLLPECSLAGVKEKAEQALSIVNDLNIKCDHLGKGERLTVSAGVSFMVPNINDCSSILFREADKALYVAKQKGRNCYSVMFPELTLI